MQGHSDTQSGAADRNQVSRLEAVLHQMQHYAEQASRSLASGSVLTIEKAPEVLGTVVGCGADAVFFGFGGLWFSARTHSIASVSIWCHAAAFYEPKWPVSYRCINPNCNAKFCTRQMVEIHMASKVVDASGNCMCRQVTNDVRMIMKELPVTTQLVLFLVSDKMT